MVRVRLQIDEGRRNSLGAAACTGVSCEQSQRLPTALPALVNTSRP
jgi:hypothetical protein